MPLPSHDPASHAEVPMHHALSWRQWLGLGIVATGAAILGAQAMGGLVSGDDRMRGALLGGLMAAAATALGTLPVLLSQKFSQRTHDTMLGFGAGVMLAASAFSLVIPALAAAKSQGAGPWGAGSIVGAGILGGALLLLLIDRRAARAFRERAGRPAGTRHQARLALRARHHPAQPARGPGHRGGFRRPGRRGRQGTGRGHLHQDVPEGMVVALALRGVGYGRWMSAGLGVVSGLIEPVAAIMGVALIGLSASLLPWGLAAAAGAMLYVISHEIIPESHRKGHEAFATGGLMLGFVVMMLLDTALG